MSRFGDKSYDVVIVGAGPAGCAAALNLPSGMSALIVDRYELPRDVICGGVLSRMSMEQLATLGLPSSLISSPATLDWCIYDWRLGRAGCWRGERYVNVDRGRFDTWLLDRVLEREGVDVWPATTLLSFSEIAGKGLSVELSRSGREEVTVETGKLIGADGALSRVRQQLDHSLPEHWIAVQEEIEPDGFSLDRFLAFVDDEIAFYGWAIPKGPVLLVGAGFDPGAGRVSEQFSGFRERLRQRQGIDGITLRKPRARPITRLQSVKQVFPGRGNVLLAGEAAGLISPWSGEGINYALVSGRLAGSVAGSDAPAILYGRSLRRIWPRLQKDLALRSIMRRPYRRLIAASIAPQTSFRRLTNAS